jgi:hypothetical protein
MAMVGRFEEGRTLAVQAEDLVSELGLEVLAATSATIGGTVELFAGDPASSERILRKGFDRASLFGDTPYSSELRIQLARALYAQQRDDEAWEMIEQSDARTFGRDVAVPVYEQGIRAKLLAKRGGDGEPVRLARGAVGTAASTDFIDLQGDALMDLAEVLRLVDEPQGALDSASSALDLYERKGNLVSAARTRTFLDKLEELSSYSSG